MNTRTNASDVILQFEVIISCRVVNYNISNFIFINVQALCTSSKHMDIASEFLLDICLVILSCMRLGISYGS